MIRTIGFWLNVGAAFAWYFDPTPYWAAQPMFALSVYYVWWSRRYAFGVPK